MKIVFLGTSSTFPTKKRNHTAMLMKYGPESFLFDCGEGTQRQLRLANESPMRITKILITHWHGDHVLGIPGLFQSFVMNNRREPVEIYGPRDSKKIFWGIIKAFGVRPDFKINVTEITASKPKQVAKGEGYQIFGIELKHRIPVVGFSFVEDSKIRINTNYTKKFGLTKDPVLKKLQARKDIMWRGKKIKASAATYVVKGKKLTIVMDSEPIDKIVTLAKDSDLFICEGTFSNKIKDKAAERGHMTVKDAAKLAKKARAKKLVLTHFSQRYSSTAELSKEARSIFPETIMAKDFMTISI